MFYNFGDHRPVARNHTNYIAPPAFFSFDFKHSICIDYKFVCCVCRIVCRIVCVELCVELCVCVVCVQYVCVVCVLYVCVVCVLVCLLWLVLRVCVCDDTILFISIQFDLIMKNSANGSSFRGSLVESNFSLGISETQQQFQAKYLNSFNPKTEFGERDNRNFV